jgi:hypothetical protein
MRGWGQFEHAGDYEGSSNVWMIKNQLETQWNAGEAAMSWMLVPPPGER